MVKNPPANAGDMRPGFNLWIRKNLWKRKWQPTPVSLPGKSHEQRSLVGSSPWGCKELDTTEQLSLSLSYIYVCVCVPSHFTHIQLFVILWTVAFQASLSMGFSRQDYWNGLPFPSPGDLPNPRIELRSPALQTGSLPAEH